jgi:hypothetical protein
LTSPSLTFSKWQTASPPTPGRGGFSYLTDEATRVWTAKDIRRVREIIALAKVNPAINLELLRTALVACANRNELKAFLALPDQRRRVGYEIPEAVAASRAFEMTAGSSSAADDPRQTPNIYLSRVPQVVKPSSAPQIAKTVLKYDQRFLERSQRKFGIHTVLARGLHSIHDFLLAEDTVTGTRYARFGFCEQLISF